MQENRLPCFFTFFDPKNTGGWAIFEKTQKGHTGEISFMRGRFFQGGGCRNVKKRQKSALQGVCRPKKVLFLAFRAYYTIPPPPHFPKRLDHDTKNIEKDDKPTPPKKGLFLTFF